MASSNGLCDQSFQEAQQSEVFRTEPAPSQPSVWFKLPTEIITLIVKYVITDTVARQSPSGAGIVEYGRPMRILVVSHDFVDLTEVRRICLGNWYQRLHEIPSLPATMYNFMFAVPSEVAQGGGGLRFRSPLRFHNPQLDLDGPLDHEFLVFQSAVKRIQIPCGKKPKRPGKFAHWALPPKLSSLVGLFSMLERVDLYLGNGEKKLVVRDHAAFPIFSHMARAVEEERNIWPSMSKEGLLDCDICPQLVSPVEKDTFVFTPASGPRRPAGNWWPDRFAVGLCLTYDGFTRDREFLNAVRRFLVEAKQRGIKTSFVHYSRFVHPGVKEARKCGTAVKFVLDMKELNLKYRRNGFVFVIEQDLPRMFVDGSQSKQKPGALDVEKDWQSRLWTVRRIVRVL